MKTTNFKRGITTCKFIDELNMLKQNPESFWSKILKDSRFIVAIRDNYLNVYFYGQSVAEIRYDQSRKCLRYKTHKKYIGEDKSGYKYVEIKELEDVDFLISNIKKYCHIEKTCSYNFLLESKRCIDVEVTFSGVKKSIDFVLLSENGELEFYEAKYASNPEIVSTTTPRVFSQTDMYIQLLKENEQSVINSYKVILQNYKDLGIQMPNRAVKSISKNANGEPLVRLIIFGERETKMWESQKNILRSKYGEALIFAHPNDTI